MVSQLERAEVVKHRNPMLAGVLVLCYQASCAEELVDTEAFEQPDIVIRHGAAWLGVHYGLDRADASSEAARVFAWLGTLHGVIA